WRSSSDSFIRVLPLSSRDALSPGQTQPIQRPVQTNTSVSRRDAQRPGKALGIQIVQKRQAQHLLVARRYQSQDFLCPFLVFQGVFWPWTGEGSHPVKERRSGQAAGVTAKIAHQHLALLHQFGFSAFQNVRSDTQQPGLWLNGSIQA